MSVCIWMMMRRVPRYKDNAGCRIVMGEIDGRMRLQNERAQVVSRRR